MKTTVTIIWILAAAGLTVCLTLERQSSLKLERENYGLRQRLSQMDKLAAENQCLSNLVAEANGLSVRTSRPAEVSLAADEPAQELVRLRGEVEALRQQSKEIETLRANTREVRATAETALKTKNANQAANNQSTTPANGSQLELLRADYGTERTNLDVAAELRERI